MKYLIILRHGPAGTGSSDFSRELTPQGIRECQTAGLFLKEKITGGFPMPERILSSPAIRAFQTAYRIQKELLEDLPQEDHKKATPGGPKIKTIQELYLPSTDGCLEVLWSQTRHSCLLICGHNPGLSGLGEVLFGWGGSLPPCGLLAGSFETEDWKDVAPNSGRLLFERTH